MSTAIPPELEEFVEHELASGKYHSRDEVISEGLRLLREHKLFQLRKEIDAGLDQIEQGEVVTIKNETEHRDFFDKLKSRDHKIAES